MKSVLFKNIPSFYEDFDRLFTSTSDYFMDEDQKAYYLSLDLPGIKKEDLKVEIKDNTLVVQAESKGKKNRSYYRSFSIPNKVDTETIEADLKDGVLTLSMTKIEEKPKLIQIK